MESRKASPRDEEMMSFVAYEKVEIAYPEYSQSYGVVFFIIREICSTMCRMP
jgi:hypothetical protein